jgi:predicted ATP-dependent endonuclease of OLD family
MKLAYFKVSGFKRFLKPTILKINGKMTAIVGPNEAGKTSLLNAIKHISHDEEFVAQDRYKYLDDEPSIKLEACFFLDATDHEAIESEIPQRYLLFKADDGKRTHAIEPKILRKKSHREKFFKSIKRSLVNSNFIDYLNEFHNINSSELFEALNSIDLKQETIKDSIFTILGDIKKYIENAGDIKFSAYITKLPEQISEFLDIETGEHPNNIALSIIDKRMPRVLEFTAEDRRLDTRFDMNTYNHEDLKFRKEPCNALKNLAKISDLDLNRLKANLDSGKIDRITSQLNKANQKLDREFSDAWSQSDLSVYLSWHESSIHFMVKQTGVGGEEFNLVDERSEGFKQYIALYAFIMKEDAKNPILLIDEAELHLHYDAQADLIQTFTNKNLTNQVIYTTHSAGCLPEDLGTGVKLVAQENAEIDFSTSKIENNFWTTNEIGFSPVLYGMGANSLAFFPTRMALVTEGQSDAILMPTLFREASNSNFNGFQVVSGLAHSSKKDFPTMALQGQKVSYIVDNDAAGKGYAKTLMNCNISQEQIFDVSLGIETIATIEDWIDGAIFANAVEIYLDRYLNGAEIFENGFFNGNGKAAKLKLYEVEIGEEISKTKLMYILLEKADEGTPLIKREYKPKIKQLKEELVNSFKN